MTKTTIKEPVYAEKLAALISYLKKKKNPKREEILSVMQTGGDEVVEMLRSFGKPETRWHAVPLKRWKKKELDAIQNDWLKIVQPDPADAFWNWTLTKPIPDSGDLKPPDIPEIPYVQDQPPGGP